MVRWSEVRSAQSGQATVQSPTENHKGSFVATQCGQYVCASRCGEPT